MDIRDAMAEAILRDVLTNPGKYSKVLRETARDYEFLLVDNNGGRTIPEGWPNCFRQWRENLSRLLPAPDDLPEQKRGDNGDQKPDASDF